MKKILLLFLVAVGLTAQAAPRLFYVSFTDGDDTRTLTQAQSSATPWKTFAPVRTNQGSGALIDGDNILFKCGDKWNDSLIVSKGLQLSSYGVGKQPIISGFITVASWTSLGGGIYESNALATNTGQLVNSVVINGKMYAMGRYPNADASNGGYLSYEAVGTNSISDNTGKPSTVDNATWANATVVIRVKHYIIERSTISNITGNTINYSPATASTPTANFGYFLENDIDALDQFGEWYYNPTTKKIDVYFGGSGPTGFTVQVAAKSVLITPTGNNISINNIQFEGANTYCVWNWNAGVTGLTIQNCTFQFAGIDAISMENRANLIIRNNTITWCNGNGICMANKDTKPTVDNNDISNIGLFPGMLQRNVFSSNRYANGILHIPSSGYIGMQCTNNTLHSIGMHGIFLDGDSMYIYHNKVDSFCLTLDDAGGIYTGNTSLLTRKGIQIVENVVSHGIGAHYGTDVTRDFAEGIYLDDGTNNVMVLNNTSYSNSNTGFFLHNARKNTVKFNTSYNNFQQLAIIHGTQVSITLDSNIIVGDTLFSLTSSQLVQYRAKDVSQNESFASYTIQCNGNVYCSPFTSEANIIQTNWFGHSGQQINYNLATWRTATALDGTTTATPINIAGDLTKVIFRVAGKLDSKIRFCTDCAGMNNATYSKLVDLSPFKSIILLRKF